jgi:hypothetical protein
MRPEPDTVDLGAFVLDPDVDYILREDISFEQELMISLKRIDSLFQ